VEQAGGEDVHLNLISGSKDESKATAGDDVSRVGHDKGSSNAKGARKAPLKVWIERSAMTLTNDDG
jgi:hypothetical protein